MFIYENYLVLFHNLCLSWNMHLFAGSLDFLWKLVGKAKSLLGNVYLIYQ